MRPWIPLPRVEGVASRQAHADLPEGTFERELGREGFYGPSTQMYHRHPPTGWTAVEGPLRPRAFNALHALARISPRQASMVESRFFAGLDVAETAELLQVSEATVLRDWRAARAWLARELG